MAITEVSRLFRGERGDQKTEDHRYLVKTDSLLDTCTEATFAADPVNPSGFGKTIPRYGSGLLGTNKVVTNITAERHPDHPTWFVVTVHYDVVDPGQVIERPVSSVGQDDRWGITIRCDGDPWTEPMGKAFTSAKQDTPKPLMNSAHDCFMPAPDVTKYDELISVSFICSTVDGDDVARYRGKVNDAAVTLRLLNLTDLTVGPGGRRLPHTRRFAANTLKVGNITYEITIGKDGGAYFRVSLPLLYRPDTWVRRIPDFGFNTWDATAKKKVRIKGKDGQDVTTPCALDGNGQQVIPDTDGLQQVKLLDFWDEASKEMDFRGLLSGIAV